MSRKSLLGATLRVCFSADRARLSTYHELSLQDAGLPPTAKYFHDAAFWIFKVLDYDTEQGKIFAQIISYHVGECKFDNFQAACLNQHILLTSLRFKSIDTPGMLRTLRGGLSMSMMHPKTREAQPRILDHEAETNNPLSEKRIKLSYNIPINALRFKLGGVSFERRFKEFNKNLVVDVYNENIRDEYDAVKNYFSNMLGTKKISVHSEFVFVHDELSAIHSHSPQIARINHELIDQVRFELVKTGKNPRLPIGIDKSLFTMDEYFDLLGDQRLKTSAFYKNEHELFEDILNISNTKHYKQLRYLSSLHAHRLMKLRFIHKPFSFVFLVEGERKYHLVWETLDTEEATYIWPAEKNLAALKQKLQKLEDIIQVIKVQGKTAYIQQSDDHYRRIYHDYSNFIEGFGKWKTELDACLI